MNSAQRLSVTFSFALILVTLRHSWFAWRCPGCPETPSLSGRLWRHPKARKALKLNRVHSFLNAPMHLYDYFRYFQTTFYTKEFQRDSNLDYWSWKRLVNLIKSCNNINLSQNQLTVDDKLGSIPLDFVFHLDYLNALGRPTPTIYLPNPPATTVNLVLWLDREHKSPSLDIVLTELMFKPFLLVGYLHNSVDSSLPSILLPRVRVPRTFSTLYQFIFELCHVEKTKINEKGTGMDPFKKTFFVPVKVDDVTMVNETRISTSSGATFVSSELITSGKFSRPIQRLIS